MTKLGFGKAVEGVIKLLSSEMPALEFTIWDLTPFIPHLHNWRKNIVFIECDRAAIDSLVEKLADAHPNYEIYAGVKKPVLKVSRVHSEASIVIVAREGKKRREVDGVFPKLEKCLVDLLYYAKSEFLPLSLSDVLGLWEYYLTIDKPIQFNELYRYSLRRYLGWFASIFAYELSKKTNVNADARHCKTGLKNLELIQMVSS